MTKLKVSAVKLFMYAAIAAVVLLGFRLAPDDSHGPGCEDRRLHPTAAPDVFSGAGNIRRGAKGGHQSRLWGVCLLHNQRCNAFYGFDAIYRSFRN